MFSFNQSEYKFIKEELVSILGESNIVEFKCVKLKSAKYRFAAHRIIDLVINLAINQKIRIDVLLWDISDKRHKVVGRDDILNLERMYFHLFSNVLRLRWPSDSSWYLFPDENSAIKWDSLNTYLDRNKKFHVVQNEFGDLSVRIKKEFSIKTIKEISSLSNPTIQVCDLFVGLATFSHNNFPDLKNYINRQFLFFEEININFSRKFTEEFKTITYLKNKCKKYGLGVSLLSTNGLITKLPKNPINFWLYKPQTDLDKAPCK